MTEANKKTILIVDADVVAAAAVANVLGNAGYEISKAAGAVEAMGLLEEYPADMVIADLRMPDADGGSLWQLVREFDATIIRMIMTDAADQDAAAQALAAGDVQQIISKPWDDRELSQVVRSAFQKSASQEVEMLGLHRIISEIESLPPVPRIYVELSEVTRDPEKTSTQEVARVISQDPAIAAKILQIANSAYFGQRREVSTISRAVVVLGLEMIMNLVLATSVFQSLASESVPGLEQEEFWKHCLTCGMAASTLERTISRKRKRAEIAMLAGTLHDLGKLVLAQYMPERYTEVLSASRNQQLDLWEVEQEILGTTHAAVGGHLAEWWNLPARISDALHWHHEPGESERDAKMTAVVHFADIVVHRANIGSSGNGRMPEVDPDADAALGIGDKAIGAIADRVAAVG